MKKSIAYKMIGVMALLGTFSVSAQQMKVDVPVYYCMDHRYDPLIFPGGDSTALRHFYGKLDRLLLEGRGKVNIMHIGGSHVQAGIISNRLREHFLTLYPEISAGRGMIFPFKVAKTNNPPNYEVQYQGQWSYARSVSKEYDVVMGVNGITVSTSDADAEIRVFLNRDARYATDFNRLVVMGYEDYGYYEPYLFTAQEQISTYSTSSEKSAASSALSKVAPGKTSIWNESDTVFGTYDSHLQTWTFCVDNYADAFVLKFKPKDSTQIARFHFTLTGFMAENDNNGIVYHSIGVNGASLSSYLRCENFARDMALLKPDLVIFGIGINDATMPDFTEEMFAARYDSLIHSIKNVSPDCDYLFMTNNDSYTRRGVNRNGLVAQKAFHTIAEQHQGALWDVFGLMGGLGSATEWEYAGLMKSDLVHFTIAGYECLGDMLYNALMDDYAKHLKYLNQTTK